MARKGFSLMEVMVILAIVAILVMLAIPAYQNFVEDSRASVCQANLVSLKTAMDVYVMEQGVAPGDLSRIPAEYVRREAARRAKDGGFKLKLAYAIDDLRNVGSAFAGIIDELSLGNFKLQRCPSNKGDGISYGVYAPLVNITPDAYKSLTASNMSVPFIADAGSKTFTGLSDIEYRHKSGGFFSRRADCGNIVFNDGMVISVAAGGEVLAVHYKGLTLKKGDSGPAYEDPAYQKMRERLNQTVSFPPVTAGYSAESDDSDQ